MQTNHFLLLKKLKNTESAQLWANCVKTLHQLLTLEGKQAGQTTLGLQGILPPLILRRAMSFSKSSIPLGTPSWLSNRWGENLNGPIIVTRGQNLKIRNLTR